MAQEKSYIRIGELAKQTEKSVRALHLYEEVGLISPAKRTGSGYRLYDQHNIERIEYIDRLKLIGLTLTDIGDLFERWGEGRSPKESMAVVREAYRNYLAKVQDKLTQLRAIERELVESLQYLDGCAGCETGGPAHSECGPCMRNRKIDIDTPNLLRGLVAH